MTIGSFAVDLIAAISLCLSLALAGTQAWVAASARVVVEYHPSDGADAVSRIVLLNIGRSAARHVRLSASDDRGSVSLGLYVDRVFPVQVIGAASRFTLPLPDDLAERLVTFRVSWRSALGLPRSAETVLWVGRYPPR